jgi:hypothetical protein
MTARSEPGNADSPGCELRLALLHPSGEPFQSRLATGDVVALCALACEQHQSPPLHEVKAKPVKSYIYQFKRL